MKNMGVWVKNMGSKSVTIAISIPSEMFRWLEKPENKKRINRSRVFQDSVNKLMNPKPKKVHPMSILVMIMGMAFGVGCIVAAMTMFFSFLFTTTLFLIGAVVLLAALVTMIKETKNSRGRYASTIR